MTKQNLTALAATLCFAATAPAAAVERDWHLYPSTCTGGAATVSFACGDYGRFLIVQTTPPPGCTQLAGGTEESPGYPTTPGIHHFPAPQKRLREITMEQAPFAMTAGASVRRLASGAATQVIIGGPPPQLTEWIGVIDFDSPHGESTTWLAGAVAGSSVTAALAPLDAPELAVIGPVADFHVLAKLCEIAESVDGGPLPAPATVNMSFGRPVRPFIDPTSPTACPVENVACQISRVIRHVKAGGTWFVAAAGNHGSPLFPSSLDDVVSAGMLDMTAFVGGVATRPAWETPSDAEAFIPGSALCLNSWAAPSGSSYSSAMLAGWLVKVLDHPDVLATLGDGAWLPAWSPARLCYVLARNRKATPWCLPEAWVTGATPASAAHWGSYPSTSMETTIGSGRPSRAWSPQLWCANIMLFLVTSAQLSFPTRPHSVV
jgi:hypothetical protein